MVVVGDGVREGHGWVNLEIRKEKSVFNENIQGLGMIGPEENQQTTQAGDPCC